MSDKKTFKMTDDLIAVIRELVQLTFITGTNIVDHLRAVEMEIDEDTNKIIPTVKYIEAYNAMVEELLEKANEMQKKLDSSLKEEELDFVDPNAADNEEDELN